MQIHYNELYGQAPAGHEIYKFSRLFLGHHYYIISFCEPCPGVEKVFKKYINFTPKLFPLSWGGHAIYNVMSLYPMDATYQTCKESPGSSCEEDVNAKSMMTDANPWPRLPEWLKWPKNVNLPYRLNFTYLSLNIRYVLWEGSSYMYVRYRTKRTDNIGCFPRQ